MEPILGFEPVLFVVVVVALFSAATIGAGVTVTGDHHDRFSEP
jgi:hypothetical protein